MGLFEFDFISKAYFRFLKYGFKCRQVKMVGHYIYKMHSIFAYCLFNL